MFKRLMTSSVALAALLLVAVAVPAGAERGDDSKRKSKNGHAHGMVDGVQVEIEYGRPSARGREIWGGLVPFGKVWRTGADEATTISFSADVLVGGQPLDAGTYGLFTIPGEDSWEIIFNKVPNQWGASRYDESEDALRVTAMPAESDFAETLTFGIGEGKVGLHWADLGVAFTVAAAE